MKEMLTQPNGAAFGTIVLPLPNGKPGVGGYTKVPGVDPLFDAHSSWLQNNGGLKFLQDSVTLKSIDVLMSPFQVSGGEYTIASLQQTHCAKVWGDVSGGMNHLGFSADADVDVNTIYRTFIAFFNGAHNLFDTRRGGLEPDKPFTVDYFADDFVFGSTSHDPLLQKVLSEYGGLTSSRRLAQTSVEGEIVVSPKWFT
tara:strand:+ start:1226 stop:1819 length:594 start_codon:yes stop_codon:yes gene_type:complete